MARVLASQLDRYSVLALGEWHGAEADSRLRLGILRAPGFAKNDSFVAMECACTRHRSALDRYVAGDEIPRDQLQAVWHDVSTPGACDSPLYEQLLTAVRDLNRSLPGDRRIRVLATDPIDWSQIHDRRDWLVAAQGRHTVAAEVVSREIRAGRKGMLVYGGAHLWRNTLGLAIPDNQTLIAQLDAAYPGLTFTVMRHHGANASSERLALMLADVRPPVLLPLRDTLFGQLPANDVLGAGIPVKLFAHDVPLRAATDAFVYSGPSPDARVAAAEEDAMYTAVKKARLSQRRRTSVFSRVPP